MAGQYHCAAFDEDGTENSYVNVTVQCKCRGQKGGREGVKEGGRKEEQWDMGEEET